MQSLQADAGHPLDGYFEAAVFAFTRNGYLKLHLCGGGQEKEKTEAML